MKRILIIKLWAMGDILMATPLLTALRAADPAAHISWLADVQYAGLLEGHPLIDELIPLDSGGWRRLLRQGKVLAWLRQSCRLNAEMRHRRFDVAINCHPEKWWMCLLSVAPVRVGLFASPRLPFTRRLYTHPVPQSEGAQHSTDHYLQAARALGLPEPFDRRMLLEVSSQDRERASRFLHSQGGFQPGLPLVVLHPGTSQPSKCWPPEHFASLAALLSRRCTVVITGSAGERALAGAILAVLPRGAKMPLVAAGRLGGVGMMAALIQKAAAVVTGDTAALHIASALGTPLVATYGSTRPRSNEPLFGPNIMLFDDDVLCAPCYKSQCPLKGSDYLRCQRAITPQRVLEALEPFLKQTIEETHEHRHHQ